MHALGSSFWLQYGAWFNEGQDYTEGGGCRDSAAAPGENDGNLASDDGSGVGEKSADGRVT